MPLPVPEQHRKTGSEPLVDGSERIGPNVQDYWRWAHSDLLMNTERGVLAEYLVAHALGIEKEGFRDEWDAIDLETRDADGSRLTIEVKSAAYVQSFPQPKDSAIRFNVAPRKWIWKAKKGVWDLRKSPKRVADVYVLCLLAETDRKEIDPLDVSQWRFFVISSERLDTLGKTAKTVSDTWTKKHAKTVDVYSDLAGAIRSCPNRRPCCNDTV